MSFTHNTVKPKGLLSLWAAFLAVVAVVTAGLFSPLAARADGDATVLPSNEIGNITHNKSGNGV